MCIASLHPERSCLRHSCQYLSGEWRTSGAAEVPRAVVSASLTISTIFARKYPAWSGPRPTRTTRTVPLARETRTFDVAATGGLLQVTNLKKIRRWVQQLNFDTCTAREI